MKRLVLLAALALAGCAHEPVTVPEGPASAGIQVTPTGLIFPQRVHDLWLREGVPASYFAALPHDQWYINDVDWHDGNRIRIRSRNP